MHILHHNIENEMAILGSFLIDFELFSSKKELLRDEFFYDRSCKIVNRAICSIYESGKDIDLITLRAFLDDYKLLDKI